MPAATALLMNAPVSPSPLLDRIRSPADLKALAPDQLPLLAQEIRHELIAVTHVNKYMNTAPGSLFKELELLRIWRGRISALRHPLQCSSKCHCQQCS